MRSASIWILAAALIAGPAMAGTAGDEAAIASRLRLLLDSPETPADRRWVESLVDYREHSRLPHPERASLSLPRYRIQAHARAALRRWDLQAAIARLEAVPAKRLQTPASALERAARARWLAQASPAELSHFRAAIDPAELDEASLLVLLARDPRRADRQQLMRIGASRQSLAWLEGAAQQLPPAEYAALLALAAGNPRLAGHAAVLRGRWARQRPEAREQLLRDLRGAALSRELIEAGRAAELEELPGLLATRLQDDAAAPLAAWGLWRLDTPPARQALRAYAEDPRALPHLRRELQQWLD